ncbi:MAG TPA: L-histidine N(alpha)-methyltransferase [Bryobacteraceae bacterium]|nr:L-histidine N(alpha)-methyltransferase [Bryobacteraceae bacterium]
MSTKAVLADPVAEFAADVSRGLNRWGQKEIASKYLYDEVGSRLFEVICELPEYGVTRSDQALLRTYASQIVGRLPGRVAVAELGSGSGRKTRWILEALSRRGPTSYYPIEISPAALAMCRRELSDVPSISILGFEREYLDGLAEVARHRSRGQRLLVLFLGSTIGNFERPADIQFLRSVRATLYHQDALLLGTDLQKPIPKLIRAYDDPLGVTAAFNRNLLARINRELDADFALDQFTHEARYNAQTGSIEMHLRSTCDQVVTIPRAGISVALRKEETIWTESSHKYLPEEVVSIAEHAGFSCEAQWVDPEWGFAENLLVAC